MKKNILRDAILGGFFGLILTKFGEYIYILATEGITHEMLDEILGYGVIFLAFAFWFGLFSVIYRRKFEDSQKITVEERKKILKKSRWYIVIVELISIIAGVMTIIYKMPIELTILIFAVSLSLLVWLVGAHLGYLNLNHKEENK